jgi:hypothetical protein
MKCAVKVWLTSGLREVSKTDFGSRVCFIEELIQMFKSRFFKGAV